MGLLSWLKERREREWAQHEQKRKEELQAAKDIIDRRRREVGDVCVAALQKQTPHVSSCPACDQGADDGGTEWQVSGLVSVREYIPNDCGGLIGGLAVTPMVIVFCSKCGLVRMHSAIMLGVVEAGTGQFVFPPKAEEKPQ